MGRGRGNRRKKQFRPNRKYSLEIRLDFKTKKPKNGNRVIIPKSQEKSRGGQDSLINRGGSDS